MRESILIKIIYVVDIINTHFDKIKNCVKSWNFEEKNNVL